jgi:hypothetical protein
MVNTTYISKIVAGAAVAASLTAGQALAGAVAGEMTLSAPSTSLTTGQTVTLEVRENSGTAPVNAVQANVTYPADKVELDSIDSSASAFDIKADERNVGSTVFVARGKSGAVLTGNQSVTKLKFKATAAGTAKISFADGTTIVRSDDNTALPVTMGSLTLTLKSPATPTPTPTPKPTATPVATATPKPTTTPVATATPTPVVGGAGDDQDPTTLPQTGAEALGGIAGVGAIAYAGRAWYLSKRDVVSALRNKR